MIELRGISKSYATKGNEGLAGITLSLDDSGLVAICGPISCGKTTLLNILGGIEKPDSGDFVVDGKPMGKFNEGRWNRYRNSRVGVVFQDPVLVAERSVFENVELAMTIAGFSRSERRARTEDTLELLGIADCASKKPAELSGAQQRLVGVARALAKSPDILIADDPTSGLDAESSEAVMDALVRVSASQLVVMATSDEDLATRYASRVIHLKDGAMVGTDTPSDAASSENATSGAAVPPTAEAAATTARKRSRASMPFMTAAAYSIRNMSTRKGRAILATLASAISMIGIASIVALGVGANNYIDAMEEASIATDPIVVGKSGLDLTGLLGSDKMRQMTSSSEAAEAKPASANAVKIDTVESTIEQVAQALNEFNSHVRDNDLAGFKQYVDSNSDNILDYVDTVQYDYGVAPLIYNSDTSHGSEVLNPSTLSSLVTRRANSTTSSLNSLGGFNEMVNNQSIWEEQMDVISGRWPNNFEECVVVLDSNGGMSDLTLYNLGIYDHDAVDRALNAALSGESLELPNAPSELSYDELMSTSFTVLPRASLYEKNAARGTWADKSLDDEYVASRLSQDGINLKVVGIVQPKQGLTPLISEGVGYTHQLTEHLIDISAQSEITKEQIANPEVDVFTGKTFEDLREHPSGNLDFDNIITINESALNHLIGMFTFEEAEQEPEEQAAQEEEEEKEEPQDPEMEQIWDAIEQIDWSQFEINTRDVLDAVNAQRLYDAIALASMLDPEESGLTLSEEQQAEVSALTGEMVADFTVYAIGEGATAEDLQDQAAVKKYWKSYLKSDNGKKKMAEIDLLVGQGYGDVVRAQLENYIYGVYTEVIIDEVAADIIEQALDEVEKQLAAEIERQLPALAAELDKELEAAITQELEILFDELDRQLVIAGEELDVFLGEVEQEVTEVANEVGNDLTHLIQINLNEEDVIAYINNLMDGSEIGYDNNIAKLGYADTSNPLSMSIYPKNLAAKHQVIDIISGYNERMKSADMKDRTIIYNNSSGDTSEILSTVVDVVGIALIALVGVSLVVGCVMMVIIIFTGISARRREMGLLRTLGASRIDLLTMFNIETLLEGLLAGVISVGVVYAASAAVNSAVRNSGGADIMVLPPEAAVALVVLSGVLPLLAGLIPSLIMSRKQPAQSLRK